MFYEKHKTRILAEDSVRKKGALARSKSRKHEQAYRDRNRIKERKRALDKYYRNKKMYTEYAANRRAALRNRIPVWLSKQDRKKIQDIYKNRPDGFHVDHIVPLQGKKVSGLHVPWNLQYLPELENRKKSNKHG